MTFEQWWEAKQKTFMGLLHQGQVKLLCHEAWLIAMDRGQVDDASVDDAPAVSDVCGICRHPAEFHLPKNDKSQSPCMNVHCACEDLQ